MEKIPVKLGEIHQAKAALSGVIHETPLNYSCTFSEMAGCSVYLKLDNLQKTGSYKIRGAYNKVQKLTYDEKKRGVIASSAGNHAQGVAFAASAAGVKATIVMPEAAPLVKVMATRSYGAEVVLSGSVYDDAYKKAKELQEVHGMTFVHPFNDLAVMAGQGTVGLEILTELEDVDAIVVPIGGGGLISGIACLVQQMAPHVKVYGVQAEGAPAMYLSKKAHMLKITDNAATIADGIAVKVPGELTFPIIDKYVEDIVLVDEEAIASTMLMLLERAKMTVEGAGAISLAAVLNKKIPCRGKIACVLSGGNADVNFIARIIERGLVKAGRRIRVSAIISDRPGELSRLLSLISGTRANVLQVYHDRVERNVPLGQAIVDVSLEIRDLLHCEEILAKLRQEGYIVEIM